MRSLFPCFHSPRVSLSRRMLLPVDTREQRVILPSFYFVFPQCRNRTNLSSNHLRDANYEKLHPSSRQAMNFSQAMQISSLPVAARCPRSEHAFSFFHKSWPWQKSWFCFCNFFWSDTWGAGQRQSDLHLRYNCQHLRVWLRVKMLRLSLFIHPIERERMRVKFLLQYVRPQDRRVRSDL